MVNFKWEEITEAITFLGEGRSTLAIAQMQKEWLDIKCKSRTAVMKYNKTMSATTWEGQIT